MGAVGDIYLSVVPVQLSCPTAAVAALFVEKGVKSNLPGRHGMRQDEKNGAMHGSSIEFLTTIRPLISFHPVLLPFLLLYPV